MNLGKTKNFAKVEFFNCEAKNNYPENMQYFMQNGIILNFIRYKKLIIRKLLFPETFSCIRGNYKKDSRI